MVVHMLIPPLGRLRVHSKTLSQKPVVYIVMDHMMKLYMSATDHMHNRSLVRLRSAENSLLPSIFTVPFLSVDTLIYINA